MPIIKESIKDQVYKELRNRILQRKYAPGSMLNISQLSKELNVSNSPIREALSMLEKEHLVSSTANLKFQVIVLDENLLQQLNSAIVALLIGAVRLCKTNGKLTQLEGLLAEALERQKTMADSVACEDRYWLAVEFDRSIIKAADNQMLMETFDGWCNLLYLSTSLMDEAYNNIEEHVQILQAVRSDDFEKITVALEKHYDKHFKALQE